MRTRNRVLRGVLAVVLVLAVWPAHRTSWDRQYGPFFSDYSEDFCPVWSSETSLGPDHWEGAGGWGYSSLILYFATGDSCDPLEGVTPHGGYSGGIGWKPDISGFYFGFDLRLVGSRYLSVGLIRYGGPYLAFVAHELYPGYGETRNQYYISWEDASFCSYNHPDGCRFDLATMRYLGAGLSQEELCPKDTCFPQ